MRNTIHPWFHGFIRTSLVAMLFMAGLLAVLGARMASAQGVVFKASPNNPPPGNNGVQGVTGAGSSGFLNTAANQAAGLQANGLPTMNPVDVASGDFNGDGIQDIYSISADNSSGAGAPNTVTLTIFPGVGDGTFGLPRNFTFTGQSVNPVSLAVADIDNDGLSDVAIAMTGTDATGAAFSQVVLFYGKDLASAQPGAVVPTVNLHLPPFASIAPVAVALGRLQADAPGDIAVAETPGAVEVFLHDPATGSFTTSGAKTQTLGPAIALSTARQLGYGTPRAIAIGQSNLSSPVVTNPPRGNLDVIIAGQDPFHPGASVIAIVPNSDIVTPSPPFSFATLPAGVAASGVAVGDINGDGIPDLVSLDHANGSAGLYLGQDFFGFPGGYGTVATDSYGAGTDFPTSLSIMNFSGTGQHDLATVNQGSTPGNGKIRVLTSNAAGTSFTLAATFANPSSSVNFPTSIATGRWDVRSTRDDIVWVDAPPSGPGGDVYLDSQLGYVLQVLLTGTAPGSTSVPVLESPAFTGVSVNFTSTVSGVPAGTKVTLVDGGFPVATGATDAQGNVTFSTNFVRPGNHTIVAVTYGTFSFPGSASPFLMVNVAAGSPLPSITGITGTTGASGPPGSTAIITGSNFVGPTQVSFGGVPSPKVTVDPTGTVITAIVPLTAKAGSAPVIVTTNFGNSPPFAFTVTASPPPVITSIKPPSAAVGATVTITGTGFTGTTSVSFGGTRATTVTVVSDTQINVVVPAGATSGPNLIEITAPGGTASGTFTVTGVQTPTTTTVTAAPSPSTFGQSVKITATVAPTLGTGTPTGTVAFTDGVTGIAIAASTLVNGVAVTATTVFGVGTVLAVGSHSILAHYSGDANFSSSDGSTPLQVNKADTKINVTPSANPSAFGASVMFAGNVASTTSAGPPTGTVTLIVDGFLLTTQPLDDAGHFSLTMTQQSVGTHTVEVEYSGDSHFNSSGTSLTQVVNKAVPIIVNASLVEPAVFGQTIRMAYLVASPGGAFGGPNKPTGTVTFFDNGTQLGAPVTLIIGTLGIPDATLVTSSLPVGTHNITAVYSGDNDFTSVTSTASVQVINPDVTTVNATPSVPSAVAGQPFTIGGTVSAQAPGVPTTLAGPVTVVTDTNTIVATGTANAAGQYTIAATSVPAGTTSLTVKFGGNGTAAASSVTIPFAVSKANVTLKVTGPMMAVVNTSAQYQIAANPSAPSSAPVSGSAKVTVDGNPVATIPITNGAGVFTTSFTTAATHKVGVNFLPNANYNASSAPAVTVNVTNTPCAVDVSSQIAITRSGYAYNFTTQQFLQTVTLTNAGNASVQGPISLVLDGLSSNATLFNASGWTACAAPLGSPFINLAGPLNPGAKVSVVLQFTDPTKAGITYQHRVLAGSGSR